MRRAACLTLGFVCAAAACSQPSSVAPSLLKPPSTTYAGQITDSVEGVGTARVTLTTAAGVTGGTWDMAFGGKFDPTIYLNGAVAGSVYTGTLTNGSNDSFGTTQSGCSLIVNATLTDASFSGSYKAFAVTPTCPVPRTATFNLIRQ